MLLAKASGEPDQQCVLNLLAKWCRHKFHHGSTRAMGTYTGLKFGLQNSSFHYWYRGWASLFGPWGSGTKPSCSGDWGVDNECMTQLPWEAVWQFVQYGFQERCQPSQLHPPWCVLCLDFVSTLHHTLSAIWPGLSLSEMAPVSGKL